MMWQTRPCCNSVVSQAVLGSYGTSRAAATAALTYRRISCSEPSHCSDVDEQPRLEETRLELSDDDTGSGQDPSLELEEDEMEASWAPGSSVGDWFPKGQPMNESSQVIILNVYLSLKKLPIGTLKDIVSALGGTHAATVPFALRAAAGLLCLSPIRIYRTVIKVKQNGWRPVAQPSCNRIAEPVSGGRAQDNDGMQVQKQKQVLLTLTRAALGTRSAHAPASEYVKHIARLAVEGVHVGHKYHTREHFKDVEFLAARCLQSYDAQDIRRPLSGLGIRSDFAILMDGVPVGGVKAYGRHGTVVVICLSGVSPHTQIACQIHCMVQAEPWAWRRGDSGGCRQRPRGAADCSHIERAPCELEPRGRGWRRSRRRPRPEESWDTGRRIVMEHGASSAGTG